MRAIIQRVSKAAVHVDKQCVSEIDAGLLVLLGVGEGDTEKMADYLVDKIINLRVFTDTEGKMNLSLLDTAGELLVVSQFTLYGDCRRGRRPSYSHAAPPNEAKALYQYFVKRCQSYGIKVGEGVFAAHMEVSLTNDGPVTLLLDSNKNF